ncbi:hypothetical protein LC653_03645 [Nostoc sp. CHAB 5784]|uniref:hypothetical protein n=1 Tax=Nostoc mirabile TaxID=2907820 RepID=UPI001E622849|nr:hypothetical protein [Nostoc mirabile]MCC5663054.1 hypothetical protein [Nostoc mirabile CHAB5784]
MPFNEDLLNLIELIQGFVPKVQLTGIESKNLDLQLAKIENNFNTYNKININFGTIGSQEKPLAIITSIKYKNQELKESGENVDKSLAFLPEKTPKSQKGDSGKSLRLELQDIPFSSGFHLIINQKDWWIKKGTPEEKSVLIGDIKFIPINLNEWAYIKTIETEQQFGLLLNKSGVMEAEIWRGDLPPKDINNLSPEVSGIFKCTEYKSGETLKFESVSELAVSLDKNVVEKAILIEYKPKNSPKEYFVFILVQQ